MTKSKNHALYHANVRRHTGAALDAAIRRDAYCAEAIAMMVASFDLPAHTVVTEIRTHVEQLRATRAPTSAGPTREDAAGHAVCARIIRGDIDRADRVVTAKIEALAREIGYADIGAAEAGTMTTLAPYSHIGDAARAISQAHDAYLTRIYGANNRPWRLIEAARAYYLALQHRHERLQRKPGVIYPNMIYPPAFPRPA